MAYIEKVNVGGVEYGLFDGRLAGENLMPNSREIQIGSSNVANGVWRLAGTSNMTRSRVEIDDGPFGHCWALQSVGTQTANDASCWGIDAWPTVSGGYYTMSLYVRCLSGSGSGCIYGGNGYGKEFVATNGDGGWQTTGYRCLTGTADWQQLWVTVKATATNGALYMGCVGTDATVQICHFKIEGGDHVTPWTPAPSDLSPSVSGTVLSV